MKNIFFYYSLSILFFPSLLLSENFSSKRFCGLTTDESIFSVNGILGRPYFLEDSITTEHFIIHYSLAADDTNKTTQSFAESTAVFAERCRQIEIVNLGWAAPIPDEDSLYDFYIYKIPDGVLGRTVPEGEANTNDPRQSWIAIKPGQSINTLRHTIAHELHHASQYSYTYESIHRDGGAWFYENTAEWMTQYVYGPTDIQFLNRINGDGPLFGCHHGINYVNGAYEYGGALWCNFLIEWTGDSLVIMKIWEQMGVSPGQQVLQDINTVLSANYGRTLDQALQEYAVWRNFTGKRKDTYHFKNASTYTALRDAIFSSYPVMITPENFTFKPSGPGGCKYLIFRNAGSSVTFTFNGESGHKWFVYVVSMKIPQPSIIDSISLDDSAYGSKTFTWGRHDSIAVIPIVLDTMEDAPSATFSLTATVAGATSVTFTNSIGGANAGGTLYLSATGDSIASGDYKQFNDSVSYTLRTLNERFTPNNDSIYKHNNWNGDKTQFTLKTNFIVSENNPQTAIFSGLVPAYLRNELIEAPDFNADSIRFSDPWFLNPDGSQSKNFKSYDVRKPFFITGAYNQDTGGVFLNQYDAENPDVPYYAIEAESVKTMIIGTSAISSFESHFEGWETQNATLLQVETNPSGFDRKTVIFTDGNAFVKALYSAKYARINSPKLYGWNLVSIPDSISSFDIDSLFQSRVAGTPVFGFQNVYSTKTELSTGKAYWVKYSTFDNNYHNDGKPIFEQNDTVAAGWNMIGTISVPLPVIKVRTLPDSIIQSNFFGFKNGVYAIADTLQPGQGYWVKMNQAGVLILNAKEIENQGH